MPGLQSEESVHVLNRHDIREGSAVQGRRGRAGGGEEARAGGKEETRSNREEATSTPGARAAAIDLRRRSGTLSLDIVRGRVDSIARRPTAAAARSGPTSRGPTSRPRRPPQAWRDRAAHVREQLLVTLGLWPMFPKTPLNPQVYGKLERDGYTIEKVVLETFPGFTLSGNLYRPAGKTGKVPGMLCPHGHWEDGRVNPEVQQRCIRWAKLGLRRLHVRHGRLQRQQAVRPRVPERPPAALGPEPGHAPDLEQHPGPRLADDAARRRPRADRLHGRIGRRDADLPAHGDRRPDQGLGAGRDGLRHVPGRLRLRERRRAAASAPTTSSSPRCAAPGPLKLVGATGDWTKLTMTSAYPALRGVYSLVGSTDRVSADVFDFPHNYNQTTPQRRLRLHGPLAPRHRRPGAAPAKGKQTAREARGPLDVRHRPPGADRTARRPSSSRTT